MHITRILFFIWGTLFCIECNPQNQSSEKTGKDSSQVLNLEIQQANCEVFSREDIRKKLHSKIENKLALIVHIFVPLCDNEYQGIIPVNKSLGDGLNLKTNLYWGVEFGIKTHFKRKDSWKLTDIEIKIDSNVLERLVFKKQYDANTKVILIADAYRGDRMEACLKDYFLALSGTEKNNLAKINDSLLSDYKADLLIFNGHNGLMDMPVELSENKDNIEKDAVIISCLSSHYFMEHLKCLKAYPLVTTNDFLPPEGYIAEGIIDAWALQKKEEEIRLAAGNAMYRIFKRDQKAMQRIFKTGW